MRHEDREKYTLQSLTAPHRMTWRQREYTLQCLTALHRTTWRQREVHITVSHGTTSYDLTTERGTHYSVSQHYIVRPEHRGKNCTLQYVTEQGQARTRDRCLQSLRCPALSSSFYIENNTFSKVSYLLCAGSRATRDSRAISFRHTETSGLLNSHTNFLSLFGGLMLRWVLKGICGHFHILIETWKSPSQDTSHILWQV